MCSNGRGHMSKIAVMPIYVKPLNNFFSGTKRPMTLKVGVQHWVLKYHQVYSNGDYGLTMTYFAAKSNFGLLCFCIGKTVKQ